MPHYRIILQIEKEPIKAFLTSFPSADIETVYTMFEKKVNERYGAGRVEYFNCLMVAEKSLVHLLVWPEIIPAEKIDIIDNIPAGFKKNLSRKEQVRKEHEERDKLNIKRVDNQMDFKPGKEI